MKRNIGKKSIAFTIVFSIFVSLIGYSFAATNSDLNNQKNSITNKIDEAKKQANEVKEQKEDTQQEVESISTKIADYEAQIKALDSQVGELETSIKELQAQIDEKNNSHQKNQDLLEQRLVALYEAGNTTFLDFILGAEDLTDFISKFTLAQEVTSYDQQLIEKVASEAKELETLKSSLNTKIEDVQGKKDSRSGVVKQLAVAKGAKEEEVDQLEDKQEALEHDAATFEKEAKALDAKIEANNKALQKKFEEEKKKQEEANKGNSGSSGSGSSGGGSSGSGSGSGSTEKPSSKGLIRPISSSCPISATWYYPSGGLHGALDYSTNKKIGIPVYAAADGIVIFSGWGGGDSYGNYVLIRHYNGLYTLYAHGSSLSVSTGAVVKQGQTIMLSGNTGNSTGPHLHFEVRVSPGKYANRVDPRNYL